MSINVTAFGYSAHANHLPLVGSWQDAEERSDTERHTVQSGPWSFSPQPRRRRRRNSLAFAILIRVFDILVASTALIVLAPVMLVIYALIRREGDGPAIFWQKRIGRNGAHFPCLKFRTMVTNSQEVLARLLAESPEMQLEWERTQKLREDPRVTRIGAFLRKTSLDELPQLFNILAAHMSVVGPRPIVDNEIARYGTRFSAYCSVRPGLTGLWQINGRNDVTYSSRVRLDSLFARRKSPLLILSICLRTVPAIVGKRGSY